MYTSRNICSASIPVLDAALADSRAAGLPPINVPPAQGKLLYLLARLQHAVTVLEIGTLAGYSTIWLARALPPHGRIVTLESETEACRGRARRTWPARASLERVDVRVGPALETLAAPRRRRPARRSISSSSTPTSRERRSTSRPRCACRVPARCIIVDNVVRSGELANAETTDESVRGMQQAVDLLANHPRLDATVIQTVGAKGYDGFALAIVR